MPTTGLGSAMTPGISTQYYEYLGEHPEGWREVYGYNDMTTSFIDEQGYINYQTPTARMPMQAIDLQSFYENFGLRYVADIYSSGDQIAYQDLRDDIYGVYSTMIPSMGGGFARSFRTAREIILAGMFINYAFAPGNVIFGPDRLALFSLNHPLSRNNTTVTWANTPSSPVDFSVAAYNFAWTNLMTQPAPDGQEIRMTTPARVIMHPSQRTIGYQVLKGQRQPNTSDYNISPIPGDAVSLHLWPYFKKSGPLGSTFTPNAFNAWMVQGKQHYIKYWNRETFRNRQDSDIITDSEIFVATMEFSYGWSWPYGMTGSTGL